jgi:uroporphyrinogen decarboxylase
MMNLHFLNQSIIEFRKVRQSHEFFEICRTPELATEITLQPIKRYTGLIDAAIIFSDILVIPQAMGMEVIMNPGPHFPDPLVTPADITKLSLKVDVDKELGYMFEAISKTRRELNGEVPLIGFCGAPWTLFAYMIEGGGSKSFTKAKSWLFRYPEESKALLEHIANVCVDFLVGQVKAGAQASSRCSITASRITSIQFPSFFKYSIHGRANSRPMTFPSFPSQPYAWCLRRSGPAWRLRTSQKHP